MSKFQFEWFDNPDESLLFLKDEIIPKMIIEIKTLYLNRHLTRNKYRKLRNQLNHSKPIRIKSLKKILCLLHINPSDFNVYIKAFAGNANIYNFSKAIGFSHPEKIKQTEYYLSKCRKSSLLKGVTNRSQTPNILIQEAQA